MTQEKLYRVRASFFDATNQMRVQAWHVWAKDRRLATERGTDLATRYVAAKGFRDMQIYGVDVVPKSQQSA